MKKLFTIILFFCCFAAMAQKENTGYQPNWSVSLHFDHISLPSFARFKPSSSGRKGSSYFKSWNISVGRQLYYPADGGGSFTHGFIGFIRNAELQNGFKLGVYQGFTTKGRFLLQAGLEGGMLMMLERRHKIGSSSGILPGVRFQWTAGIFANGGIRSLDTTTITALSYKLWLQGPYIRKHAPALPHQSTGLIIYK